jgi:hypothetical protein
MQISKTKLSNIIWIVFLLGVLAGYVAHDNRDAGEINIAANNLNSHRTEYMNTTILIPDDIYIIRSDINGTPKNK